MQLKFALQQHARLGQLVWASLLLASASAANASAYQGYVSNVFALGGKVMVTITNGAYDGAQAACGGNASMVNYVADPSTAFGRALFALALSSKLTGKLVWAGSDGVCSGGYEGLVALDLKG